MVTSSETGSRVLLWVLLWVSLGHCGRRSTESKSRQEGQHPESTSSPRVTAHLLPAVATRLNREQSVTAQAQSWPLRL